MPELPEVETVRRGLESRVVGRRFELVEVGRERTVRRTSRDAVIAGLTGATMTVARRRGKYLVGELDTGDAVMIHLRMSGQVLVAPVSSPRPAHTHVVARLAGTGPDGAVEELRFVDPRTFGEVVVFDPALAHLEVPELARLGIDPIADDFPRSAFAALLRGRDRQLKAFLLDQRYVAGLGNIYTDEVLFLSRLHPQRTTSSVTPREITRLHTAILGVLTEAVASGGSTLGDAQYVDVSGGSGTFQERHAVYGREGLPCVACGRPLRRLTVAGRGTFVCPRCQRS